MVDEVIELPVDRRGMNPIHDSKLFRQYRAMLKEVKPDLVLAYTIKPNIYGGLACRMAHIPYAVNITGLGSAIETAAGSRSLCWRSTNRRCRARGSFF